MKPVYKLVTETGREIIATANHPFLTKDGWKNLEDLRRDDHYLSVSHDYSNVRVAVPRFMTIEGKDEWDDGEIAILAKLCASRTHWYYENRLNDGKLTELEQSRYLGLKDKITIDTVHLKIPDQIFGLNNEQLKSFIQTYWEINGWVGVESASIGFKFISEAMGHQFQHLLLRFGIISFLYVDNNESTNTQIVRLTICGGYDILRFMDTIGHHLFSARNCGINHNSENLTDLHKIQQYLAYLDPTLEERINQPPEHIYWDKVVSIELIGEEQTYDLTIEDTHNFVANDIIVHNSHASDYAVITVQTAFLKTHYPEEYMAALLTVQRDDSAKVSHFLEECRRLDIPILPPDINYSMLDFDIQPDEKTGKRGIRFGVAAVKNAGVAALEFIITERETNGIFKDLEDFCDRVDLRQVGKRTMESIIKVGALRDFGKRSQLYHALERIMSYSANVHKDKEVGQMNMFGDSMSMADEILQNLPDMKEFTDREMLTWEKELLGLYVTGRPVDKYRDELSQTATMSIQVLKQEASSYQEKNVAIAGEISTLRKIYTKNNDAMGVIQVEDWHDSAGTIEVVLFPRTWNKVMAQVETEELSSFDEGTVVMIGGKFDTSRGDAQIIADTITQNFSIMDRGDTSTSTNGTYDDNEPEWIADDQGSNAEPPPAWGDSDELYDEETGEVVKLTPPPVQEVVSAVAPATQGAVAQPTPTIEPQFPSNGSTQNGDDPDWTKADPDAINIEPVDKVNDSPPERWIQVYFRRSGDDSKDRRRLQRVHGVLIRYHGNDRFTIVIEGRSKSEKPMILEFPNNTTNYSDSLISDLRGVLDDEQDIEVFDRPV